MARRTNPGNLPSRKMAWSQEALDAEIKIITDETKGLRKDSERITRGHGANVVGAKVRSDGCIYAVDEDG